MIRHDESELNFCLLLADKFAPKSLFAVEEELEADTEVEVEEVEDSCCRLLAIVDELIAVPELIDLF